jgi:tetratricopeptide (TPR) repeat protein
MAQVAKTAKSRKKSRAEQTIAPKNQAARTTRPVSASKWIPLALFFGAALVLVFIAYGPALNGDFVFDDRNLAFYRFGKQAEQTPIRYWFGGRPAVDLSFYLNYLSSGLDRFAYHATNIVLHALCATLLLLAVRRILELANVNERLRHLAALFSAGVFLLHPVQTEAVTYIASRSENLSLLFFLVAFNVFLYRREVAIRVLPVGAILLLYALAVTSKEHTVVLPAVLLLTDYYWNPGFSFSGIRRNWKLYVPIALGAILGLAFVFSHVNAESNLGFGMKDFTWYQYLFTQFRAFFVYLRLLVLPVGQMIDYNFPISRTVFDRGAIIYGLALAALAVLAFIWRKKYPIATYGFFVALILLAPTSSIMPIKDPLAERRLYLPFIGFALIACEALVRIRMDRKSLAWVLGATCLVFGIVTFHRNGVWVSMVTLWQDTVDKNPINARAQMGLGTAYALSGHCLESVPSFERGLELEPKNYQYVFNLASAYECSLQNDKAIAAYQRALTLQPKAEAWAHIGFMQMRNYQFDAALTSLDKAQQMDPHFLQTYNFRGILYLAKSRFDDAAAQFQRVLSAKPDDAMAIRGLDRARRHVAQY